MRKLKHLTLFFVLLFSNLTAQADECGDIEMALGVDRFSALTEIQKKEARDSANWSSIGTLLTFCFESNCFVIKACEKPIKIIDVSDVVKGSVYQIGWSPTYDRIENRPVITSENRLEVLDGRQSSQNTPDVDYPEIFGTRIRTRIWDKGQRYTVYKSILIQNDKILYQ